MSVTEELIREPMVSVIVPIFNGADTLPRCVDSVLRQTLTDLELLLVDDGSTDGSAAMCDAYAARDARVRVLHQENAGVSISRNRAIDLACGKYLQFLDCDDWLAPEAAAQMVTTAEEQDCDLVVSDFFRVVEDRLSHKGNIPREGLVSREEFADYMLEKPADYYYGVLWNKLFRRSLIETLHLRMDPEINWCEDFLFNLTYLRACRTIFILRQPLYYYVRTKKSLSSVGVSPGRVVAMKRTVFEQYEAFYRDVFPGDSTKTSLQVYRFFVAAAGDGIVPPAVFSDVQRLGEERVRVNPETLAENGLFSDHYRTRKCLEKHIEAVAFRCDLSTDEAYLLFCLGPHPTPRTRQALADDCGISRRKVSNLLQRLASRGYITCTNLKTEGREPQRVKITLLPPALELDHLFRDVEDQHRQVSLAGLTEAEAEQYLALSRRVRENINQFLTL